RRPWILVRSDILPARACRLDLADDCGRLPLHVDAERLDVADVRRQSALAADRYGFVDRRGKADSVAGFIADMAVVHASTRAGLAGERYHLIGLGEALRCVEESSRETQ